MTSSNFTKNYPYFCNATEPRNSSTELWKDLFIYSTNLTGNWLLSKQIFYANIVPTAEKNPAMFARWVKEMVKKSGVKIKSRAEFIEAINYLRKLEGKTDKNGVRKALYHLFESGIGESSAYACRALKNNA